MVVVSFPTKNDHFRGVLGIPPFKETPKKGNKHLRQAENSYGRETSNSEFKFFMV